MQRWFDEDAARLARTETLLANNGLHAAIDYYRAAFILQHGNTPEHYLRAHHLAMVALAMGYDDARWISAASLDRYLLSVGRPQIYGTQFRTTDGITSRVEPFDRLIANNPERQALSVPPVTTHP